MKEEMKEFSEGQLQTMEAVQIMENGSEQMTKEFNIMRTKFSP